MTIELLILFAAAFVLSCTTAYAIWCNVRVTLLRQDLFEIRDELWLQANAMNGLNDIAYQETRRHINALIRMAGLFNIPVFEAVASRAEIPIRHHSRSANTELDIALSAARKKAIERVVSYIFLEHASGYLKLGTIFLSGIKKSSVGEMKRGFETVSRALASHEVDQLSEVDRTSGRDYYATN